jgi:hypothetical protein
VCSEYSVLYSVLYGEYRYTCERNRDAGTVFVCCDGPDTASQWSACFGGCFHLAVRNQRIYANGYMRSRFGPKCRQQQQNSVKRSSVVQLHQPITSFYMWKLQPHLILRIQ